MLQNPGVKASREPELHTKTLPHCCFAVKTISGLARIETDARMSARVRGRTFILYVSVSICTCRRVMFKPLRGVCAVSVCFCVCVLYPLPRETGLLPGPDSVIGSSENPNEAMSISAAAWLPLRSPRSPRAPTPSPLASLRTRCKERRDGIC